jgi:lipid-A-disaccharide synthase
MKYYIIAGEASGDLHGSNLIKELRKLDHESMIRCWGGDKMKHAGATLVKHYRDLAFMGFVEVIKNLPAILNNLKFCREDINQFKPDVIILIDYPGFNLRIAKWAKENGYRIIYYISPQVWAWKENRVKSIKKVVDRMLVILPFEKEFYKKWDYQVIYVGHPLVQVVNDYLDNNPVSVKPSRPIIALLPGSRKQEVLTKLPIMLQIIDHFKDYQFVIAKAPSLDNFFYQSILGNANISIDLNPDAYQLLSIASAALVTSGTATLETALFNVPEVVCYKGSTISYQIARRLIKIKFISLVNLIMNKPVVTELIQDSLTAENLTTELNKLLNDPQKKEQVKNDYLELKNILQQDRNASARAAQEIIGFMQSIS